MKKLVLATLFGGAFLFAQERTVVIEKGPVVDKEVESTTVSQHHGKYTKTDTTAKTTVEDAKGTSTDTVSSTNNTKRRRGKVKKSTTTTTESHTETTK